MRCRPWPIIQPPPSPRCRIGWRRSNVVISLRRDEVCAFLSELANEPPSGPLAVMVSTVLPQFILASRSPRRKDLLGLIVPNDRIRVVPPRDAAEAGFEGLGTLPEIQSRLVEIAHKKLADVVEQLADSSLPSGMSSPAQVVIAADTTLVVPKDDGSL